MSATSRSPSSEMPAVGRLTVTILSRSIKKLQGAVGDCGDGERHHRKIEKSRHDPGQKAAHGCLVQRQIETAHVVRFP